MNGSLFWFKKSISVGITLIMVYLIVSLGRNVWRLWQAGGQVTVAEAQIKQLSYEQYRLGQRLKEVGSETFVDQQIREQLQLGKAGEMMVLVPGETEEQGNKVENGRVLENWER